jgi:hypothetical protein
MIEVGSGGRPLLKELFNEEWDENEKKNRLLKRKFQKDLILKFCQEKSKSVIYVLSKLTFEDQEAIQSFIDTKNIETVIVLHN